MAIFDDLQALYDNGWDASFDYKGQVCGIFPNSVYDIVVIIADNEYRASSFTKNSPFSPWNSFVIFLI